MRPLFCLVMLVCSALGAAQPKLTVPPAYEPRLIQQKAVEAGAALEVIRPVVDEIEPGKLARILTVGPTRWTVYEPAELQTVIESDRSLLFAAPVAPGTRISLFATVEVDGPDIFQPFVIKVKGAPVPPPPVPPVPPGPGPGPGPGPNPPAPDPPAPTPVPPNIVDHYGVGKTTFVAASAVNSPNRAAEAKAIAGVLTATADRLWAWEDLVPKIWPQLWEDVKTAAGANAPAWSPFIVAVRAQYATQKQAGKIATMADWRLSMKEVAARGCGCDGCSFVLFGRKIPVDRTCGFIVGVLWALALLSVLAILLGF